VGCGEIYAGPLYVSTDGSDEDSDGSPENPFATIQHGIDATSNGDTVLVYPGTYVENINYNGKNIVVGSLFLTYGDTSYISQTVIDGNQDTTVVNFRNEEDSTAVLSGFVITNDNEGSFSGISLSSPTNPRLENLRITGISGEYSDGIKMINASPILTNVTISNNSGHGLYSDDSNPGLVNCILWNNSPQEIYLDGGAPIITYSDIQGGYEGEGNIDEDPLFVDAENGDYHLSNSSPCIGAGTLDGAPDTDMDGNPRPNPEGSNPDMGAYENALGWSWINGNRHSRHLQIMDLHLCYLRLRSHLGYRNRL
jgi:hypothetical protein